MSLFLKNNCSLRRLVKLTRGSRLANVKLQMKVETDVPEVARKRQSTPTTEPFVQSWDGVGDSAHKFDR